MKPIFLVDDSATILLSMSDILTKAGYTVEKASNGPDALARIKSGLTAALMITDYHMPGMTGVELIREARKLPAFRFVPILVLTTESEQGKRDEAKAAGATGWLVKPVPADKLIQVIKQVVPGTYTDWNLPSHTAVDRMKWRREVSDGSRLPPTDCRRACGS